MHIFHSVAELGDLPKKSVVTVGKFDGIHLGHQALIATTVNQAKERGIASVLVTFDKHPDAVLNPERVRPQLLSAEAKQAKVGELGIDSYVELPFTSELAAVEGEVFVKEILVDALGAQLVVVGPDFRFGRGGACDVAELTRLGGVYGFEVQSIEPVEVDGQKVSTSAIRDAAEVGDVKLASKMLGYTYQTCGMVEHGLKIGRTIGFPTANISREGDGYLPRDGVYAGWLRVGDDVYPAAHSVGINETFQAVPRLVESHVIGRTDLDLYDKVACLEYVDYIRPAAKFNGVEDLVSEINRDIEKIKTILGV